MVELSLHKPKELSFQRSKELYKQALEVTPHGRHSGARRTEDTAYGYPIQYPIFFASAKGSHFTDVDGNEFVDYVCAQGPIILGHCHPAVNRAVAKQLDKADIFGHCNEEELALSKKLVKRIPCAEQVMIMQTGTQADFLATRLARAYTGKRKVVKFWGHYHGYYDWTFFDNIPAGRLASMGMSMPEDTMLLPWNEPDILEKTLEMHGNEIAAVICEAFLGNCVEIMPEPGYLETLRKLTKEHGIVLIFDEVITGFRLALGGAQEKFDVTPDLATFAKSLANGFPIAAIAGKKEIMEAPTYIGGTFNGHPILCAAALATVNELEKPGVYKRIYDAGETIIAGIRDAIEDVKIEAIVQGLGCLFTIIFTDKEKIRYPHEFFNLGARYDRRVVTFYQELLNRGVFNHPSRGPRWHLTAAHTEEDASRTIEAAEAALKKAKEFD